MSRLSALIDKCKGYQNRYGQSLDLYTAFKKCLVKQEIG